MTHYETLGIEPGATDDEVRLAYRRAARKAHPDLESGSTERMQAVNEAYESLRDAERRERYAQAMAQQADPVAYSAAQSLRALFDSALNASFTPAQMLCECDLQLKKRQAELKAEVKMARQRLRNFEKRLGKFRVNAGTPNMIEELLRGKTQALQQEIEAHDRMLKVAACAIDMLKAYSADPDDELATWAGTLQTSQLIRPLYSTIR